MLSPIVREDAVARAVTVSLPRAIVATAVLLAAAVFATGSRAQGVDVYAAMRHPAVQVAMSVCTADRNRLCGDVMPGGGRIVRCLAAKSQALSPECRSGMERARDALVAAGLVKQEVRQAQ